MNIQTLYPDFDHEMHTTRRFLERVPMDRADFKPDDKSRALGSLANHLASLPGMGQMVFQANDVDVTKVPRTEPVTDHDRLLTLFDERVAALRAAIENASDADLAEHWRATAGPQPLIDQPRAEMVRWLISHSVHHRAQLGTYLRTLDVPVPAAYGPSADER